MGIGHAHYVIAERGGHRVWSRHRGAATFHRDLLRGPDDLIAFVRDQEETGWMNAVWWQAVAVLDVPRRLLLVHCDLEIPCPEWRTSLLEIRAWLELVAARWPGWTVTWATRRLHQVMDHLGLGYDTVGHLADPPSPLPAQWGQDPEDDDGVAADTLVAVRDARGSLSFTGRWVSDLADVLLAGPGVLLVPQERAAPFAIPGAVPWSGVHLDAVSRTLDWWSLHCSLPLPLLAARWPGWTVTGHGDAYEEVAALIGPELLLDPGDHDLVRRRVTEWFLPQPRPARPAG